MELLAECERKYKTTLSLSLSAPSPPPSNFPLSAFLPSLFNSRRTFFPYRLFKRFTPTGKRKTRTARRRRTMIGERERKRKEDTSIDGESIVSFISVPQIIFFRSPAGRTPWRGSPYCDSVIVVRFWKIAHCESILKTGDLMKSFLPVAPYEYIGDMLRPYGKCLRAIRIHRDGAMLIFLRLISFIFFSFFFFHIYVRDIFQFLPHTCSLILWIFPIIWKDFSSQENIVEFYDSCIIGNTILYIKEF